MESIMETSPDLIWFIAGGILLVVEFTLAPAVGFLFAGLAAFVVGFAITSGLVEDTTMQWIVFCASTLIWALFLWKPMKNWRQNHDQSFSDISGEKVEIVGDLEPGKTGKAKWSGADMKARLAEGAEAIKDGTEAEIVEVRGNVLIVK